MSPEPWFVVIDAQRIFAAADSPWGSPMFPATEVTEFLFSA